MSLYDVVKLKDGQVGTIVYVFKDAYDVELESHDIVTVKGEEIKKI